MFSSCNPQIFAVRHILYTVNRFSEHFHTDKVAPSSDRCCIESVVPPGDHCFTETVAPYSDQ